VTPATATRPAFGSRAPCADGRRAEDAATAAFRVQLDALAWSRLEALSELVGCSPLWLAGAALSDYLERVGRVLEGRAPSGGP
jgi:hypothetical protein